MGIVRSRSDQLVEQIVLQQELGMLVNVASLFLLLQEIQFCLDHRFLCRFDYDLVRLVEQVLSWLVLWLLLLLLVVVLIVL